MREEPTLETHERGLVVGLQIRGQEGLWSAQASLDELEQLAITAGVDVVARVQQTLERPRPATLIGSGKVAEIRGYIGASDADIVLFDEELSPRQQRNLEAELNAKVVDRTALILDVFAQHARTHEGRIQVELAQYEYRLPRLTRMWTHLARQAGGRAGGTTGGVGVRGPGETQLETDRREIRRKIAALNRQIEEVRAHRRLYTRRRRHAGMPVVGLVGYTNAGKSTLLNALSGADVYVADQLFATLDPTTRRILLPQGSQCLMTDTVGFIQKLPPTIVAAFRATLEEVSEADVLLHVVDITHHDAPQQAETVEQVLAQLGVMDTPMVVALNKVDLFVASDDRRLPPSPQSVGVGQGAAQALLEIYPDAVQVSALRGLGLDRLLARIEDELAERLVPVELLIPYTAGELLNQIHERGLIESEEFGAEGTHIKARLPRSLLGAVRQYVYARLSTSVA
jgi:GTP-binding protein HflX